MRPYDRLKIYYPSNILEPSTPYVYFESLLKTEVGKYIYRQVKPYFSKSLGEVSASNAQNKISSALNFLNSVIKAEAQKEMAFIQFLTTKIRKNKIELQVPSSSEDWSNFIQDIQTALNGTQDLGLKSLLNEFKRLETNTTIREKASETAYFTHHLDDQVTIIGKNLSKVEAMIDSQHNTNEIGKQIYNIILNQFGAELFEVKNNDVILNRRQLAVLIQTIAAMALKNTTIKNWERWEGKKSQFNLDDFIETIQDDSFISQTKSLITQTKNLPWVSQDLLELFQMQTDPLDSDKVSMKERNKLLNARRALNASNDELQSLSDLVRNMFQDKNIITEKSFKVVNSSNEFSEVISNLTFGALNGTFFQAGTGSKGTKPDNLIAMLTVDLSQLDPKNTPNYKEIVEKITRLREIMKTLTGTLKSTNTTDYYQTQKENWDKAEKEMKQILDELSELYKTIVDCYTIEDSTKNYVAMNARSRGVVNESFHGGSLGARLGDQLAKISALSTTGGFDMLDITWLTAAIINSGPNMIASNSKNSIEQYLSTFAALLLFDDQVNIADEAIREMASSTGSSINKIHLFSLNSGYYPLSYVLQLTHDALEKGYNDILSELQSGSGVKVNIVNYVTDAHLNYMGWTETANTALNSTKLEVQFMVHFMSILNTLLPNFN